MKGRKRHLIVWRLLRPFFRRWMKLKFAFEAVPADVRGPYLVLANHNTDWDPFLAACSFKEQMYFVASEHIFRWGLAARLISWLVDPISRLKATNAGATVLNIMRRLRRGYNVCVFAEGDRAFTGATGRILPSTGKLARSSGVPLVTYRYEGGYFTSPRWGGDSVRRGRMRGYVVNVYSPEQLKAMTVDEVNAAIARDLHEDAYARQREAPVAFKGKNRAQFLERVLCVCPKCGGVGTLKSGGNSFSCTCGYRVEYGETCFFEGDGVAFDDVGTWDDWQTEKFAAMADAPDDGAIFSDGDVVAREILPGHDARELGRGALRLFRDRLELPGLVLKLDDVLDMALHGPQSIDLSTCDRHLEIVSPGVFCARKYLTVFSLLRARARAARAV